MNEEFDGWFPDGRRRLMRLAYLLTGGDPHGAEDLVQTSLTKLYLAWERVQRRDSVDAYARRVLINEFNSTWRRPARRLEIVTDRVPEASAVIGEPRDAELFALVRTLPERQRAVLVLRYYEDLSEADIAAVLGISRGSVKAHTSRGMQSLRARLPEQYRDESAAARRDAQ